MLVVHPSGATLGATVEGIDLGTRLAQEDFAAIVRALARHGVLCFPRQTLDAPALKAFSAHFGTLEVNVAGRFQEPGLPEVMILSNIVENGHPIGSRRCRTGLAHRHVVQRHRGVRQRPACAARAAP